MAFPQDNLAPGERVVIHEHPHWKSLLAPILIFWLLTAICGLLIGLVFRQSDNQSVRLWGTIVVVVIWAVGSSYWLIRPLVSWKTTHFVVTDRRVIYRNGIINRSGIDIPIRRINTVSFHHGLIDRMLRTGTLVIESASDDPLPFSDIPRVEQVHAQLYHELLELHDDEDLHPGSRRPDRRGPAH